MIDSTWYSTITDAKNLYQQLTDQYLTKMEGALLLTMKANVFTRTYLSKTVDRSKWSAHEKDGLGYEQPDEAWYSTWKLVRPI